MTELTNPPRLTLERWLQELETNTTIEQTFGGGYSATKTCALGVALTLTGRGWNPLVVASAMAEFGVAENYAYCNDGIKDYPLAAALREVYRWNDIERLTFPQIAARFRRRYPELLAAEQV
jgi:hypothetical protein